MTPEQLRARAPKNILIFNWFWSAKEGGETTEAQLDEFGFRQIYGNMTPFIEKYRERSKRPTIIGGAQFRDSRTPSAKLFRTKRSS